MSDKEKQPKYSDYALLFSDTVENTTPDKTKTLALLQLSVLEEEYRSGKHPEAPWIVSVICNNLNLSLPPWANSYFADIANGMIFRDDAIGKEFGAFISKLMGGINGDYLKSIRKQLRDQQAHDRFVKEIPKGKIHTTQAADKRYREAYPKAPTTEGIEGYKKTRKRLNKASQGTTPPLPRTIVEQSKKFLEQFGKDQKQSDKDSNSEE